MLYDTLKVVHLSAVGLSFLGFAARGIGVWRGDAWVRHRIARTLPHAIDTILLLSAGGMLWVLGVSPWSVPWLRAKITGLVCYILCGMLALRPRLPGAAPTLPGLRAVGGFVAVLIFAYIVSVALSKDPRGLLLLLH